MADPADDRLARVEAELERVSGQLAEVAPLLRALLKKAPKRHQVAAPTARTRRLSDEERAKVRRKVTKKAAG